MVRLSVPGARRTASAGGLAAARRPGRRAPGLDSMLYGLLGVAVAIAAWQAAVWAGLISPLALPGPLEVARRVVDLLASGEFYAELLDTLTTWALAMALTVAVAVPCGLLIGSVQALYPPIVGLVHALRSIPSTALIPIAILFFGLGFQMKLAVVCYAVAWPLLLNSIYGVQAIDSMTKSAARSLRWGRWRTLTHLVLPGAAQYIGTGVRLSGAIGLVVVLSAELLGASHGVGTLVFRYSQAQLPAFVYAGIILTGAFGMLVYQGLTLLERALSPWAPEHRGGGA